MYLSIALASFLHSYYSVSPSPKPCNTAFRALVTHCKVILSVSYAILSTGIVLSHRLPSHGLWRMRSQHEAISPNSSRPRRVLLLSQRKCRSEISLSISPSLSLSLSLSLALSLALSISLDPLTPSVTPSVDFIQRCSYTFLFC